MQLPGRKKRGRPQRRSMDVVKEEIKTVGVTGEEAKDDPAWRPVKGSSRKKKEKQKKVVSGLLRHEEAVERELFCTALCTESSVF